MKSTRDKNKTATKIEIQKQNIIIFLASGSIIVFRKSDYPYLAKLKDEQLGELTIFAGGDGIMHKELDIHLNVEYLIQAHGVIGLKKVS